MSKRAEMQLHALLETERIERRAVYRPGEICRLLRISPTTLRQLCELAEQPASPADRRRALNRFALAVIGGLSIQRW